MELLVAGAVFVLVVVAVLVLFKRNKRVRSRVNGKLYAVLDKPDAQEAADMLARLETALDDFVAQHDYLRDPRIQNILDRWKPSTSGKLTEIASEAAYSLNKRKVFVCLRGPDGSLEPYNNSMYVLLHELGHIASDDFGHTPVFWANFRYLLELAERSGTYTYADHADSTYCGHPLGENAMRCVHEKRCASALK